MKIPKITTIMICLTLMMCFLTACGNKTPQTVSGFSKVMESAGFETQDVTDDTETKDLATSVIVAVGENYQIEFYELVDSETGEEDSITINRFLTTNTHLRQCQMK